MNKKYSVIVHQCPKDEPGEEYTRREAWGLDHDAAYAKAKELAQHAHDVWSGDKTPIADRVHNGECGFIFTTTQVFDGETISMINWWTVEPEPECC